jgi:hypothetical protein
MGEQGGAILIHKTSCELFISTFINNNSCKTVNNVTTCARGGNVFADIGNMKFHNLYVEKAKGSQGGFIYTAFALIEIKNSLFRDIEATTSAALYLTYGEE